MVFSSLYFFFGHMALNELASLKNADFPSEKLQIMFQSLGEQFPNESFRNALRMYWDKHSGLSGLLLKRIMSEYIVYLCIIIVK